MRRPRRFRQVVVACALAAAVSAGAAASATAAPTQESMFQDDYLLVFKSPASVARTMDTLRYLGVDRVRVTVFWNLIAPNPASRDRPRFDATDPAAYPPGAWRVYDTIVRLAAERGIGVNFNVWGALPAWAGGSTGYPPFAGHFDPSAVEFGRFMTAIGRRYDGRHSGDDGNVLPRVPYWSLWNEPNGISFLAPTWQRRGGTWVEAGAAIYRALVDAAWNALTATGHLPGDTVLVGETAPKAKADPAASRSIRPLRFIRALYCVDGGLRPLRGAAASLRGCPTRSQASAFPAAHPGLFRATGFAHHPYQLLLPPTLPTEPDSVATADIPRLTGTLDGIFRAYRRSRRLPIYNTEFGYESRPPSAFGIPLFTQAAYLNESEFMGYRNPRLASYSQFLLSDSSSAQQFQSGLIQRGGQVKPAFAAYRTPIWIPNPVSRRGRFRVWGLFRPGRREGVRTASIQFAPFGGSFATVATASAMRARGYVDRTIRVPRSGFVRLAWRDPATRGTAFSRPVAVYR
jgi:hypothetical protein